MKNITRRAFIRTASATTAVVGAAAAASATGPQECTLESLANEYREARAAWEDQHEWSECGRFWSAKPRKITSDQSHAAWDDFNKIAERKEKAERALLVFAGSIREIA